MKTAIGDYRKDHSHRENYLRVRYDLTPEEYESLYISQDGKCMICQKPEKISSKKSGTRHSLSVDHDHQTGTIRGLLCGSCNRALGLFQDNPEILIRAATYLARHGKPVGETSDEMISGKLPERMQ